MADQRDGCPGLTTEGLTNSRQHWGNTPVKPKSFVKVAVLVFILGSLAYPDARESPRWLTPDPMAAPDQQPASGASTPAETAPKAQVNKIIAYYFHTTYRCETCQRIEAYSKEAVDSGFARELAAGKLEFRPVNVQLPENRHFIQDYQLSTKSLVLVRTKDGNQLEWTNLSRVWELTGDHEAFLGYVQQGIRSYLDKDE